MLHVNGYRTFINSLVDCQWSEWHNTRCSKSCGEGTWTKKRTSEVQDHACRGTQQFLETCNERPCPSICIDKLRLLVQNIFWV